MQDEQERADMGISLRRLKEVEPGRAGAGAGLVQRPRQAATALEPHA